MLSAIPTSVTIPRRKRRTQSGSLERREGLSIKVRVECRKTTGRDAAAGPVRGGGPDPGQACWAAE